MRLRVGKVEERVAGGRGDEEGNWQTATCPANFRSFQKRRGFMALPEVTRFREFAAFPVAAMDA